MTLEQAISATNKTAEVSNDIAQRAITVNNDLAQLAVLVGLQAIVIDGLARELYGRQEAGRASSDGNVTDGEPNGGNANRR